MARPSVGFAIALGVAWAWVALPADGQDVPPSTPFSAECPEDRLESVYFDFDESVIRTDQEPRVEDIARCARAHPERALVVHAYNDPAPHTEWLSEDGDPSEPSAYQLALSERYGRSVMRQLERLGIAASRLASVAHGAFYPLCTEWSESCWRQLRRADVYWADVALPPRTCGSGAPERPSLGGPCPAGTPCPGGAACQCDEMGRLRVADDDHHRTTYDAAGRVETWEVRYCPTVVTRRFTYHYDEAGQVSSVDDDIGGDGTIEREIAYQYGPDGGRRFVVSAF